MVNVYREDMGTVGITALVPPEIVYATGNVPLDINNFVPGSGISPKDKLCAWTAIWRDLALMDKLDMEKLVVVAGGDCNNAVVDGEKLELSGIKTHYYTYPFDGSPKTMKEEITKLMDFLGKPDNLEPVDFVAEAKKLAIEVDRRRVKGDVGSEEGFSIEVSGSDLGGNPNVFIDRINEIRDEAIDYDYRLALLGTPPIYTDFHRFLESIGFHVVYDEMPYEFIRHGGGSLDAIAADYAEYTFARNISYRLEFIKKELSKRDVDGVIHFHQFACHHKLEDPILRNALTKEGYPFITIEADLPSKTTQQIRLRMEAFKERLGEFS